MTIPFFGVPKGIIREHLPPSGDGARTCGPGPFSMADQEMVTKQLQIAGYDEIQFERIDMPLMVGNTLDNAVDFQLAIGPAGEVYREAGDTAKTKLSKHETDDGIVMQSSSWKIRACNP